MMMEINIDYQPEKKIQNCLGDKPLGISVRDYIWLSEVRQSTLELGRGPVLNEREKVSCAHIHYPLLPESGCCEHPPRAPAATPSHHYGLSSNCESNKPFFP